MADLISPNKDQRSSSSTVTVACKLGVPWIDFEVCEPRTIVENTQTGPRDIQQWFRTGQKIRIRGTSYPRGEAPEGFPEKPKMVLGYALTENVPRALWEQIVDQQKRAPYFQSGMIYHFERVEDIKSKARDYEKQFSGLEPIQRDRNEITDERMPHASRRDITNVLPGTRSAA